MTTTPPSSGPDAPRRAPTATVVVPAHDEERVVGRCLDALLRDAAPGELDVVVVASACTDRTAEVARAAGPAVRVVEEPRPGKWRALSTGDAAAQAFPRVYLDADVVVTTDGVRRLVEALDGGALVAGCRPVVREEGASRAVRWHYRTWQRLPVTGEGYVGSGVYALGREGHARVFPLPEGLVADDELVRRSFRRHERAGVDAEVLVTPPRTAAGHVRRAVRARRGNAEVDRGGAVPPDDAPRGALGPLRALRRGALPHEVLTFVVLTAAVRALVLVDRRRPARWHRDESSRRATAARPNGDIPSSTT